MLISRSIWYTVTLSLPTSQSYVTNCHSQYCNGAAHRRWKLSLFSVLLL